MKVLIYTASSMCNPQFGIQMERAIEYANKGDEVMFCHCAGAMSACSANPFQNKAMCRACEIGYKAGLKKLPKTISVVKLTSQYKESEHEFQKFSSVSDIKAYGYKNVEVGFSCLSVYITKTRNPNPQMSIEFLDCINKMIAEAKHLVDAAEAVISDEKPDLIIFFNGRFFDTKPFYNLAVTNKIDFIATENVGGIRAGNEYRMVKFEGRTPHDPRVSFDYCLASWNNSKVSDDEKKRLGSNFFEYRRIGKKAGDYVYTGNQKRGELPVGFDENKKNVIVFTSSEDEFSAVSNEIDSFYIFSSQYEAIKYMSENIGDENYHFYVRIHPNMKGVDVEYHRNLYKLRSLPNVTVIAPEETVSSYTLMDVAYNVVTFGSTIGAEALYWGKSVVLLGFSAYYYWNCCLIPRFKEDVINAIKQPTVYSNAKEMAIKYGYYYLENSLAEEAKYINITPVKTKFIGKTSYSFDYLRIMNSMLLFKLINAYFSRFLSHFYKNGIQYTEPIRNNK